MFVRKVTKILTSFCHRSMSKEQHRDYRDKERDRCRDDRFSRACKLKNEYCFH